MTISKIGIVMLVCGLIFGHFVYADEEISVIHEAKTIFEVEDPSHTKLPANVQNALKKENPEAYKGCDLVGSLVDIGSTKNEKFYAVSGRQGRCAGSGSAPLWIVQDGKDRAKIILSAGGFAVKSLSTRNNSLNDLQVSGGNAGSAFIEYWQYDGKNYLKKLRKIFDASCKDFKNDPDNPFDCGSDKSAVPH